MQTTQSGLLARDVFEELRVKQLRLKKIWPAGPDGRKKRISE